MQAFGCKCMQNMQMHANATENERERENENENENESENEIGLLSIANNPNQKKTLLEKNIGNYYPAILANNNRTNTGSISPANQTRQI